MVVGWSVDGWSVDGWSVVSGHRFGCAVLVSDLRGASAVIGHWELVMGNGNLKMGKGEAVRCVFSTRHVFALKLPLHSCRVKVVAPAS
ncbi:hypothetical protein PI95_000040 [Hassallia byssoidea VB512170]|uniref:Uncharacterized protein n=1 Tax=Hassallia byssoidea VB512170 TaxID=1304833 RepID=A0A846H064_9CYAN|nr:hypothetical protein [Hassalia byssoidea]NEU71005.1 hypothetical protein [Hassalia byssoidea VB512170]